MGIPGGVVIASSCLVKKSNSLAVHQGVPGACECPREQKAAGLIKAVLKTVKQNSRNCNVSRIEVDSGKKKTFESKEVVKLLPAQMARLVTYYIHYGTTRTNITSQKMASGEKTSLSKSELSHKHMQKSEDFKILDILAGNVLGSGH